MSLEDNKASAPDAPKEKPRTRGTGTAAAGRKPVKSSKKKTAKMAEKTIGTYSAAYAPRRTTFIGDMLYALGFYAEYFVLRFWRVSRDAFIFIGQILMWLFGDFIRAIFGFIKAVGEDLTAPFVRIYNGVRNMRTYARQERAKGNTHVAGGVARYFGRGVKSYAHLIKNTALMVIPLVFALGMAFVVHTIFTRDYALAVEVNGNHVGYVTDETVLEEAQSILRMKVTLAPNQRLEEWEFQPVLTIAPTTHTSNKSELADGILMSSPDELMVANGLYVDGVLVGATAEGEQLRDFLQGMLDEHKDADNPDAAISFVRDVEVSEDGGVFFTESVQDFEELQEQITQEVSPQRNYIVTQGDTLLGVAHKNGLTVEQLVWRNPELEGLEDDDELTAGAELLIQSSTPYLQVQKAYRNSEMVTVAYETEEVQTDRRAKGSRVRVQEGEDGIVQQWYDEVWIDGELVEKVPIDYLSTEVKPVVNEIYEVGTFVFAQKPGEVSGDGGAYNPAYYFPVPDSVRSSRGFMGAAHRGVDINAPSGTPIYAANGGIVVTANYHWSWGNHVVIEHADGYSTLYAHCTQLFVSPGQVVSQGQLIAAVGSTGQSTGPHCHFEVINPSGQRVDPYGFVVPPY